MSDSHTPELPRKISRQEFLRRSLLIGGGIAATSLVGLGVKRVVEEILDETVGSSELPVVENTIIAIDKSETKRSLSSVGIEWTPDGHIPYITFPNGDRLAFTSGNAASYRFNGKKFEEDLFLELTSNERVKKPDYSFGPDIAIPYRNGYSGITTVFQIDTKLDKLYALTHNEQWKDGRNSANFTASVGLLESNNRGKTWTDKGQLITGQDSVAPDEVVSGAGQPCGVVREADGKKYLYIYYIDWPSRENIQVPDQIYLARTELTYKGVGRVEHYTETGFKTDIKPREKHAVITPPTLIPDSSYAALPSVSYNAYLEKYLAAIETNVGFCITKSKDGIAWEDPQLFFLFPQTQANRKTGDKWYSYPTLVSKSEPTDQRTSREGTFYFSRGRWNTSPHQLSVTSFKLK